MLHKLIGTFKGNSTLQNKALVAANTIMNTFYKNNPKSILAACKLADKVFSKSGKSTVWVYTHINQSKRKSGGSGIVTLIWPGISNDLYAVNVTDQDKGSGRTMSCNRRSCTLGRHRLTSWTIIRSTTLWLPLLSNTNDLKSYTHCSSSRCARRCSKANSIQLVVHGLKIMPTCHAARCSHGSSSMASATSNLTSA
jgi:hypothetical protein